MSRKCKAFSQSKLGLEAPDNRKAFYAGWDAAKSEWDDITTPELNFMRTKHNSWVSYGREVADTLKRRNTMTPEVNPEVNPEENEICAAVLAPAVTIEMLKDQFPDATKMMREWVGLTDHDIHQLRQQGAHSVSDKDFRAIEAKLKEKNI